MAMLKSKVGMPAVTFSGEPIDLPAEAARSRQRLYPVSVLYTLAASATLGVALATAPQPAAAVAWYAGGWVAWTLAEYLVHRYVLHWRFPDGPGAWQHFLHVTFDSLHSEHHARPWDGNHINGAIHDTLLFVTLFGALAFLAPAHTAPALWAGFIQAYVVEEWVHHSVHFKGVYPLRGRYWRYITRHHCYHHSPRGSELAFGLTSGLWDAVFDTRIPEAERVVLYGRRR